MPGSSMRPDLEPRGGARELRRCHFRESLGQCGPGAVTPRRGVPRLRPPDPAPRMGTLKKATPGLRRKTTVLPESQVSFIRV